MPCPNGYHSHEGATSCHPIDRTHKNPETQKAHQQALANAGKRSSDAYRQAVTARGGGQSRTGTSTAKPTSFKPKTNYASSLRSMLNGGNVKNPAYFPKLSIFIAMAGLQFIYKSFDKVSNKNAVKNTKKGYEQGWEQIDKLMTQDGKVKPDRDWTPEERKEIKAKVEELLANVKHPDAKNTVEYGQAMVYRNFLNYLKETYKFKDSLDEKYSSLASDDKEEEGTENKEEPTEEQKFSVTPDMDKEELKQYNMKDPKGYSYRIRYDESNGKVMIDTYNKGNGNASPMKSISLDEFNKFRQGEDIVKLPDSRTARLNYILAPVKGKEDYYVKRYIPYKEPQDEEQSSS